jgi:hypothetical protein
MDKREKDFVNEQMNYCGACRSFWQEHPELPGHLLPHLCTPVTDAIEKYRRGREAATRGPLAADMTQTQS